MEIKNSQANQKKVGGGRQRRAEMHSMESKRAEKNSHSPKRLGQSGISTGGEPRD